VLTLSHGKTTILSVFLYCYIVTFGFAFSSIQRSVQIFKQNSPFHLTVHGRPRFTRLSVYFLLSCVVCAYLVLRLHLDNIYLLVGLSLLIFDAEFLYAAKLYICSLLPNFQYWPLALDGNTPLCTTVSVHCTRLFQLHVLGFGRLQIPLYISLCMALVLSH